MPDPVSDLLEEYLDHRFRGSPCEVSALLARHPEADSKVCERFRRIVESLDDGPAGMRGETEPAPDLPEGEPFGPYRLIRELGRGGQGTVHLALDTRLSRSVAIKLLSERSALHPETPRRPGPTARLQREAQVASKLAHPVICTIFETGVEGGVPYIAMRYVEGESLAAKIARARERGAAPVSISGSNAPLPGSAEEPDRSHARLLRFFEEASKALDFAHEAGVIHRDVKPSNLMVTPAGEPVWLDFGLARDEESDLASLTRTGDLLGTPAYMSPEQLDPTARTIDRRTDVYSLGVALYECLTLRRPFEAATRQGLFEAIRSKDPSDPRSWNRAIPRDLLVVLETALEKDRARRYQTARDFAEDLRRVREHEPIRARPASLALRARRWSQRNPALAASILGLFILLSVGLGEALWFLRREIQRGRELEASYLTARAAEMLPRDPGLGLLLAIEAEEQQPSCAARTALHTALFRLRERRTIQAHQDAILGLAFSPDHRWLATASRDRTARIWDPAISSAVREMPVEDELGRIFWSPDGAFLFAASYRQVFRWRTSDWKASGTFDNGANSFAPLSRDESRLATISADGSISLWMLGEGSRIVLRARTPASQALFHPDGARLLSIHGDGSLRVWDAASGDARGELLAPGSVHLGVLPVTSPKGTALAFAHRPQSAQLLDLESGAALPPLETPSEIVSFAFSPDGGMLALGLSDGTTALHRTGDWSKVHTLGGHERAARTACFSESGAYLLTSSFESASVWDVVTGNELAVLRQLSPITGMFLDETSMRVVSSGRDGTLRTWNCTSEGERRFLTRESDGTVFLDSEEARLLTVEPEGARIFDASSFEELLHVEATPPVSSATWSPDHRRFVTASRHDGIARVYDAATGATLLELRGSGSPVWFASFDPSGRRVVTAPEDRVARVFDVSSGDTLLFLRGHEGGVRHAVFSLDGRYIATTSEQDRSVRLWDAETGDPIVVLEVRDLTPMFSNFSPDGTRLVSATRQGIAPIWDWRSRRIEARLAEHEDWVTSAQFSPDGRLVLTSSRDGLVRLWNASTGEVHADLKGHGGEVRFASFGPLGRTIVSSGPDGIRTWPVDVLAAAKALKPRELTPEERRRFGLE